MKKTTTQQTKSFLIHYIIPLQKYTKIMKERKISLSYIKQTKKKKQTK
jgi:hypothetical protein